MKKVLMAGLIGVVAISGPALGHPTDIPFDSYGQCTAFLHQQDKIDRDNFSFLFQNNGQGAVVMLDNWDCEYDPGTDAWYIVDLRGSGGGALGNGNGNGIGTADH